MLLTNENAISITSRYGSVYIYDARDRTMVNHLSTSSGCDLYHYLLLSGWCPCISADSIVSQLTTLYLLRCGLHGDQFALLIVR